MTHLGTIPIENVDKRLHACVICGAPSATGFQAWQRHYILGLFPGHVSHAPWFGYCRKHSTPRYRLTYSEAMAMAGIQGLL